MKKAIRQADLMPFTSNNPVAETIGHVFRQDGYVVATDGHIVLRVPVDAVSDCEAITEQDKPLVSKAIPEHFDKPRLLRIKDIETALDKAPKVSARKECPECDGGGMVTWTYDGKGDCYEHEFRCPCCDGNGYVRTDGEMVPDHKQVFTMLDNKYHTKDLQRLIRAFGVAGVKKAKILSHQYHNLYMEAGPVQILIAGIEKEDCGEIIKVI